MAGEAMYDERGRAVETVTATAAKNGFGSVLETALSRGVVAMPAPWTRNTGLVATLRWGGAARYRA